MMQNDSALLDGPHRVLDAPPASSNPEDVPLELFLKTFSAAHLARPLPSFDADTPDKVLRAAMERHSVSVVGLRSVGLVTGWKTSDEIAARKASSCDRPFPSSLVIDQAASFRQVISQLAQSPWLLVRSLDQINGVIQLNDIDRPPMRMWLFGLITVMELRVNRLIEQVLPHDRWKKYLSPGRLQKAQHLSEECQRQGEPRRLVDCLQFADKGRIIGSDENLRRFTRFQKRREVEDFAYELQMLRNKLAHALALTGEWPTIVELVENMSSFVEARE